MHLDPTGALVADGATEPAPFRITADQLTITADGATGTITLRADGAMTLGGDPGNQGKALRVDGADTPGKRRLVLALMALSFATTADAAAGSARP